MTAVDRYVAICYPFVSLKLSSKMVHKLVMLAWVLSLFFSIPQTFIFSYKTTPYGQKDCWASFEPFWTLTLYITIFTVLVYILPTGILMFCYGNICIEVWKSSRVGVRLARLSKRKKNKPKIDQTSKLSNGNSYQEVTRSVSRENVNSNGKQLSVDFQENHSTTARHSATNGYTHTLGTVHIHDVTSNHTRVSHEMTSSIKPMRDRTTSEVPSQTSASQRKSSVGLSSAKIKTVKMTLTVVLCYFLCWSPFFIAQMWAAWDETAPFNGRLLLFICSSNKVYQMLSISLFFL